MTCKECIHYEMCGTFTRPCMPDEANASEKLCSTFKNKTDFVKVVRCKDCKHCRKAWFVPSHEVRKYICSKTNNYQTQDDFCNYGEKRDT